MKHMSPVTLRRLTLAVALAFAVAAAYNHRESKGNTGHAAPAPGPSVNAATRSADIPPTTAEAESPPEPPPADIFAVRTWEPPKPVVVANPGPPPPPPPPQAPPLPFRLLGKIDDPQRGMVFLLARGDDVLPVIVGDDIDGGYRVDKFANGRLDFIYQPLAARQSLFVGSDL